MVALGLLFGRVLLDPRLRIDGRRGDWRSVSRGLAPALSRPALAGGERALVHAHDLRSGDTLEIRCALRSPAVPVSLEVTSGEREVFAGLLPLSPLRLRVQVPAGADGVDVWFEAAPFGATTTRRPLYLIQEIEVATGSTLALRVGQAVGALFGLLVLGWTWTRGPRPCALVAGALAAGLGAALVVTLAEPQLWLRFAPGVGLALRLAALLGVTGLGLFWASSRLAACVSILAVTTLLFAPTVRYGLVYDDFLWLREWSLREVASTFVGSEDPRGVSNAYYRPLASTSHALENRLFRAAPEASHLTNVLLRAFCGFALLILLARLGLSPGGALAGALAWVCHPLGASAVAWISQRTDELATLFFLCALCALVAPSFTRLQGGVTLALALLALGSKETAVTLPLMAFLVVRIAALPEPRARRLFVVGGMTALVAAYLALWVVLFPARAATRFANPGHWSGFEPASASFWGRLLPGLLAPILVPTDYADWWGQRLGDWPVAYFALALAVGPLALWIASSCRDCGCERRVAALGLLWPLIVVWPLLGIRSLDLYRLGVLLCAGYGLLAGAVVSRLERRSRWLAIVVALALVMWLAPKSVATAEAWGPGGFYWEMTLRWNRTRADWLAQLSPQMRELFREQVAWRDHTARPPR